MSKTKTTKVSAMGFYHPDGLVPAWKQAARFAGEEGRLGILPDVIDARLSTEPDAMPWAYYSTTLTAEYFGLSKGGNKILIVAQGIGPMATLDGALKAYSHEYKGKARSRRGGRISSKEFLDLESGKFGEVQVIDFEALMKRYKYPFLEILRESQALAEPLLMARLGPKAEEYIKRHTEFAREWHKEKGHEKRLRQEEGHGEVADPFIIKMGDASNCGYIYHELEDDMALAHLVVIGALMRVHHENSRVPSLVCDVACHEWWNGTRLLGIRGGEVTDIHPGADVHGLLRRHWRRLMKPVQGLAKIGFRSLMKVGEEWFTQYPKQGARMDTWEPEFLVTSCEEIGKPVKFTTKIQGHRGFFKYDIKEVWLMAPTRANAYATGGSWVDNNEHTVMLRFYRVKADTSKRLMREDELCNKYKTLMDLLDREENAV